MQHRPKYEVWIVIFILAVASFFRFYQLSSFPPGLYPDEAVDGTNGIIANNTGHYQLFYTENNGREGLFINLQALSIKLSGIHAWALRDVSGIFGVLTVLGLYLLARELFNWRVAAISGFLLAISFWHVNFSRIGFDGIMVPFILVYLFYFLWRGLRTSSLWDFFWAGVFGGLGFYTYSAYRLAPMIVILLLINYWFFLKKDYGHDGYMHARNRLLAGVSLLAITAFFVALPMGLYFLKHPGDLTERAGQVSVFSQPHPWQLLAQNTIRTLGMFSFSGDGNPRHNIPGAPMLGWPIGILFVIGFIKELVHWLRRKHGHLSPTHTLLFSWFAVMLLPGILSVDAPHALRVLGAAPIVILFSARGLLWLFHELEEWEVIQHPWEKHDHKQYVAPVLALFALLAAFTVYEYHRYFYEFGPAQVTQDAFSQSYVNIANQINALPNATTKYVVVTAGGVEAFGLPMPAQTVMFLTDTVTPETQKTKHVVYLTSDQVQRYHFDRKTPVFYVQ